MRAMQVGRGRRRSCLREARSEDRRISGGFEWFRDFSSTCLDVCIHSGISVYTVLVILSL